MATKFRTQADTLPPNEGGIDFTNSDDRCRREFGPDVDIPTILRRFGVVQFGQPPRYGAQEVFPDQTDARQAVADAQAAYAALPQSVRDQYPSWRDFFAALMNGQIVMEAVDPAPAPTEVSSVGGGAAPSDSAAGAPAKP